MPGTPNTSNLALGIGAYLSRPNIGKYNISYFVNLASIAAAALLHLTPGHKGRLTKVTFVTHAPATTASKAATVTPSIAGTNVTGGVLALTTVAANTADKELAGTAITAANAFTASQTITLTGSAVTAFAEGSGWIILELVNDELLEAVAIGNDGLRTP